MKPLNEIKTYLDESGNSGKNLLDPQQPFFTLGAVLINEKKLKSIEDYLIQLPDDLKEENGEIKGNNIACYNQPLALEILSEFLPEHTEMMFFSVLEKKFMIAGQIVENYFDYVYNDNTDESWTIKSDKKIQLANFFYDHLSSNAITNSHNAFISNSIEQITNSFNQIIDEIKDITYDFDVVSIMKGAKKHLQSLTEALSKVNSKLSRKIPKQTVNTPNVTTYFEIIGRIEKYLTTRDTTSILIFDNSEQYNHIFKDMIEKMIAAPRKKMAISDSEYLQFGFLHLVDFKVDNSNNEIGLQVADLLSSIVNHVFTKIIQKKDEDLTIQDIQLTGIIYFLSTTIDCGYWTISNSMQKRIGEIFNMIR